MSMARMVAVLVATVTGVLGLAGPVAAGTPETWTESEPRPLLETLGIFVGMPLGLFVLITLACLASSSRRGPRYRPDEDWAAEPEWFADSTPVDPTEATGELTSAATGQGSTRGRDDPAERGGASARW